MNDRSGKVWRGGRPKGGVSNLAHTKRKIPKKYKEDSGRTVFQTSMHKAKSGKCALYLILYILPIQGVHFNPLD